MECLPNGQRGQRLQAVPIVGSKANFPSLLGWEGEPMVKRSGAIGSDQPGRLRLPFRAALAAYGWVIDDCRPTVARLADG